MRLFLAAAMPFYHLYPDLRKSLYTLESGLAEIMEIVKKHYTDAEWIEITASCPNNRHMACEATIEYCK